MSRARSRNAVVLFSRRIQLSTFGQFLIVESSLFGPFLCHGSSLKWNWSPNDGIFVLKSYFRTNFLNLADDKETTWRLRGRVLFSLCKDYSLLSTLLLQSVSKVALMCTCYGKKTYLYVCKRMICKFKIVVICFCMGRVSLKFESTPEFIYRLYCPIAIKCVKQSLSWLINA